MRIWLIMIQADDGTVWVQQAWDDDSTSGNRDGWEAEVDAARELVAQNPGYDMRIVSALVHGLADVFKTPNLRGDVE